MSYTILALTPQLGEQIIYILFFPLDMDKTGVVLVDTKGRFYAAF